MEVRFPGPFRLTATLTVGAVLLFPPPRLRGETPNAAATPAGPQFVAALVRNLGDEDYHVRVRADEQLIGLGLSARAELEKAAMDDDPELRLRAKALLKRIQIEDLWRAGHTTIDAAGKKASDIIRELGEHTGNNVLLGDQYGQFDDQTLETPLNSRSFWPLLDEICRNTSNRLRPHFDPREPGLVVSSGKPGDYPTAYAGPIRAQIISARRAFTEELDFETGESEKSHTFQMTVQMSWESRFHLVAYRSQAELVAATTNVDTRIASTQPSGSGWNVAGSGARQMSMTIRLHPPATAATKLDSLSLKWGLIAVGDLAALEVTDLASRKPHFKDDVELRVESVEESPGGRCELDLLILRDVVLEDPQEAFFQECEFELVDQTGVAYRKQGQTNGTGRDGARVKLTFVGEGSDSKPARLKFTYPRIRSQRDVVLTFRDVPLPCGRPE